MLQRSYIPFFFVAVFHLMSVYLGWQAINIYTKPLLMPALALGLYGTLTSSSKNLSYIKSLFAALACSTVGDVLLQFETILHLQLYFFLGLGAFLCAQCLYILTFIRLGPRRISKHWLAIYLLYYIIFLAILYPGMAMSLRVPVTIYGLVLTWMAWESWRSFKVGGFIAVVGALFFVLSDSLIAINRFRIAIPMAGIWIMLTYLVAQYLIVRGITYQQDQAPFTSS